MCLCPVLLQYYLIVNISGAIQSVLKICASAQSAMHGLHGWSAIPEFYYLMWFSNLILKLCLYCREIMPLLLFFRFWSRFLTSLLLIPFKFMNNYFLSKTIVEEDKKNIWGFKLLTLNSLSHTILFEGCYKEYLHKTLCGRTEIH